MKSFMLFFYGEVKRIERIVFEASTVRIAETQPNDIYMSVLMRMFSTRANRNGYAVSEAFMDRIVADSEKYTCLP